MRLHAALGTGHGERRFPYIQAFPDPQQEHLLLTQWQGLQGALQFVHAGAHLHMLFRAALRLIRDILQGISLLVIVHAQPTAKAVTHRAATVPVIDATLQDTVEQRRPFFFAARGVLFHQFEHGVLHQIQRVVRIVGGDLRDPVSPALHLRKESVKAL